MSGLQRFENKLEQMISGVFARTFRSAVQPVEIAAALNREVDNSAQILSRDRRLVPNNFVRRALRGRPRALQGTRAQLPRELTEMLREHAAQQSYVFTGPVNIVLETSDDLTTGRFRVRSKAVSTASLAGGDPTEHPGTTSHGHPRAQRGAPCRWRPRASRSGAATTPTCGSMTPASPASTSRSASRSPRTPTVNRASPCTTWVRPTGCRSTAGASRRPHSPTVRRSGSATRPCPCASDKGE